MIDPNDLAPQNNEVLDSSFQPTQIATPTTPKLNVQTPLAPEPIQKPNYDFMPEKKSPFVSSESTQGNKTQERDARKIQHAEAKAARDKYRQEIGLTDLLTQSHKDILEPMGNGEYKVNTKVIDDNLKHLDENFFQIMEKHNDYFKNNSAEKAFAFANYKYDPDVQNVSSTFQRIAGLFNTQPSTDKFGIKKMVGLGHFAEKMKHMFDPETPEELQYRSFLNEYLRTQKNLLNLKEAAQMYPTVSTNRTVDNTGTDIEKKFIDGAAWPLAMVNTVMHNLIGDVRFDAASPLYRMTAMQDAINKQNKGGYKANQKANLLNLDHYPSQREIEDAVLDFHANDPQNYASQFIKDNGGDPNNLPPEKMEELQNGIKEREEKYKAAQKKVSDWGHFAGDIIGATAGMYADIKYGAFSKSMKLADAGGEMISGTKLFQNTASRLNAFRNEQRIKLVDEVMGKIDPEALVAQTPLNNSFNLIKRLGYASEKAGVDIAIDGNILPAYHTIGGRLVPNAAKTFVAAYISGTTAMYPNSSASELADRAKQLTTMTMFQAALAPAFFRTGQLMAITGRTGQRLMDANAGQALFQHANAIGQSYGMAAQVFGAGLQSVYGVADGQTDARYYNINDADKGDLWKGIIEQMAMNLPFMVHDAKRATDAWRTGKQTTVPVLKSIEEFKPVWNKIPTGIAMEGGYKLDNTLGTYIKQKTGQDLDKISLQNLAVSSIHPNMTEHEAALIGKMSANDIPVKFEDFDYMPGTPGIAKYDPVNDHIVINPNMKVRDFETGNIATDFNIVTPEMLSQVLMEEGVHKYTLNELKANPGFSEQFNDLFRHMETDEFKQAVQSKVTSADQYKAIEDYYLPQRDETGRVKNADEVLASVFSIPEIKEALKDDNSFYGSLREGYKGNNAQREILNAIENIQANRENAIATREANISPSAMGIPDVPKNEAFEKLQQYREFEKQYLSKSQSLRPFNSVLERLQELHPDKTTDDILADWTNSLDALNDQPIETKKFYRNLMEDIAIPRYDATKDLELEKDKTDLKSFFKETSLNLMTGYESASKMYEGIESELGSVRTVQEAKDWIVSKLVTDKLPEGISVVDDGETFRIDTSSEKGRAFDKEIMKNAFKAANARRIKSYWFDSDTNSFKEYFGDKSLTGQTIKQYTAPELAQSLYKGLKETAHDPIIGNSVIQNLAEAFGDFSQAIDGTINYRGETKQVTNVPYAPEVMISALENGMFARFHKPRIDDKNQGSMTIRKLFHFPEQFFKEKWQPMLEKAKQTQDLKQLNYVNDKLWEYNTKRFLSSDAVWAKELKKGVKLDGETVKQMLPHIRMDVLMNATDKTTADELFIQDSDNNANGKSDHSDFNKKSKEYAQLNISGTPIHKILIKKIADLERPMKWGDNKMPFDKRYKQTLLETQNQLESVDAWHLDGSGNDRLPLGDLKVGESIPNQKSSLKYTNTPGAEEPFILTNQLVSDHLLNGEDAFEPENIEKLNKIGIVADPVSGQMFKRIALYPEDWKHPTQYAQDVMSQVVADGALYNTESPVNNMIEELFGHVGSNPNKDTAGFKPKAAFLDSDNNLNMIKAGMWSYKHLAENSAFKEFKQKFEERFTSFGNASTFKNNKSYRNKATTFETSPDYTLYQNGSHTPLYAKDGEGNIYPIEFDPELGYTSKEPKVQRELDYYQELDAQGVVPKIFEKLVPLTGEGAIAFLPAGTLDKNTNISGASLNAVIGTSNIGTDITNVPHQEAILKLNHQIADYYFNEKMKPVLDFYQTANNIATGKPLTKELLANTYRMAKHWYEDTVEKFALLDKNTDHILGPVRDMLGLNLEKPKALSSEDVPRLLYYMQSFRGIESSGSPLTVDTQFANILVNASDDAAKYKVPIGGQLKLRPHVDLLSAQQHLYDYLMNKKVENLRANHDEDVVMEELSKYGQALNQRFAEFNAIHMNPETNRLHDHSNAILMSLSDLEAMTEHKLYAGDKDIDLAMQAGFGMRIPSSTGADLAPHVLGGLLLEKGVVEVGKNRMTVTGADNDQDGYTMVFPDKKAFTPDIADVFSATYNNIGSQDLQFIQGMEQFQKENLTYAGNGQSKLAIRLKDKNTKIYTPNPTQKDYIPYFSKKMATVGSAMKKKSSAGISENLSNPIEDANTGDPQKRQENDWLNNAAVDVFNKITVDPVAIQKGRLYTNKTALGVQAKADDPLNTMYNANNPGTLKPSINNLITQRLRDYGYSQEQGKNRITPDNPQSLSTARMEHNAKWMANAQGNRDGYDNHASPFDAMVAGDVKLVHGTLGNLKNVKAGDIFEIASKDNSEVLKVRATSDVLSVKDPNFEKEFITKSAYSPSYYKKFGVKPSDNYITFEPLGLSDNKPKIKLYTPGNTIDDSGYYFTANQIKGDNHRVLDVSKEAPFDIFAEQVTTSLDDLDKKANMPSIYIDKTLYANGDPYKMQFLKSKIDSYQTKYNRSKVQPSESILNKSHHELLSRMHQYIHDVAPYILTENGKSSVVDVFAKNNPDNANEVAVYKQAFTFPTYVKGQKSKDVSYPVLINAFLHEIGLRRKIDDGNIQVGTKNLLAVKESGLLSIYDNIASDPDVLKPILKDAAAIKGESVKLPDGRVAEIQDGYFVTSKNKVPLEEVYQGASDRARLIQRAMLVHYADHASSPMRINTMREILLNKAAVVAKQSGADKNILASLLMSEPIDKAMPLSRSEIFLTGIPLAPKTISNPESAARIANDSEVLYGDPLKAKQPMDLTTYKTQQHGPLKSIDRMKEAGFDYSPKVWDIHESIAEISKEVAQAKPEHFMNPNALKKDYIPLIDHNGELVLPSITDRFRDSRISKMLPFGYSATSGYFQDIKEAAIKHNPEVAERLKTTAIHDLDFAEYQKYILPELKHIVQKQFNGLAKPGLLTKMTRLFGAKVEANGDMQEAMDSVLNLIDNGRLLHEVEFIQKARSLSKWNGSAVGADYLRYAFMYDVLNSANKYEKAVRNNFGRPLWNSDDPRWLMAHLSTKPRMYATDSEVLFEKANVRNGQLETIATAEGDVVNSQKVTLNENFVNPETGVQAPFVFIPEVMRKVTEPLQLLDEMRNRIDTSIMKINQHGDLNINLADTNIHSLLRDFATEEDVYNELVPQIQTKTTVGSNGLQEWGIIVGKDISDLSSLDRNMEMFAADYVSKHERYQGLSDEQRDMEAIRLKEALTVHTKVKLAADALNSQLVQYRHAVETWGKHSLGLGHDQLEMLSEDQSRQEMLFASLLEDIDTEIAELQDPKQVLKRMRSDKMHNSLRTEAISKLHNEVVRNSEMLYNKPKPQMVLGENQDETYLDDGSDPAQKKPGELVYTNDLPVKFSIPLPENITPQSAMPKAEWLQKEYEKVKSSIGKKIETADIKGKKNFARAKALEKELTYMNEEGFEPDPWLEKEYNKYADKYPKNGKLVQNTTLQKYYTSPMYKTLKDIVATGDKDKIMAVKDKFAFIMRTHYNRNMDGKQISIDTAKEIAGDLHKRILAQFGLNSDASPMENRPLNAYDLMHKMNIPGFETPWTELTPEQVQSQRRVLKAAQKYIEKAIEIDSNANSLVNRLLGTKVLDTPEASDLTETEPGLEHIYKAMSKVNLDDILIAYNPENSNNTHYEDNYVYNFDYLESNHKHKMHQFMKKASMLGLDHYDTYLSESKPIADRHIRSEIMQRFNKLWSFDTSHTGDEVKTFDGGVQSEIAGNKVTIQAGDTNGKATIVEGHYLGNVKRKMTTQYKGQDKAPDVIEKDAVAIWQPGQFNNPGSITYIDMDHLDKMYVNHGIGFAKRFSMKNMAKDVKAAREELMKSISETNTVVQHQFVELYKPATMTDKQQQMWDAMQTAYANGEYNTFKNSTKLFNRETTELLYDIDKAIEEKLIEPVEYSYIHKVKNQNTNISPSIFDHIQAKQTRMKTLQDYNPSKNYEALQNFHRFWLANTVASTYGFLKGISQGIGAGVAVGGTALAIGLNPAIALGAGAFAFGKTATASSIKQFFSQLFLQRYGTLSGNAWYGNENYKYIDNDGFANKLSNLAVNNMPMNWLRTLNNTITIRRNEGKGSGARIIENKTKATGFSNSDARFAALRNQNISERELSDGLKENIVAHMVNTTMNQADTDKVNAERNKWQKAYDGVLNVLSVGKGFIKHDTMIKELAEKVMAWNDIASTRVQTNRDMTSLYADLERTMFWLDKVNKKEPIEMFFTNPGGLTTPISRENINTIRPNARFDASVGGNQLIDVLRTARGLVDVTMQISSLNGQQAQWEIQTGENAFKNSKAGLHNQTLSGLSYLHKDDSKVFTTIEDNARNYAQALNRVEFATGMYRKGVDAATPLGQWLGLFKNFKKQEQIVKWQSFTTGRDFINAINHEYQLKSSDDTHKKMLNTIGLITSDGIVPNHQKQLYNLFARTALWTAISSGSIAAMLDNEDELLGKVKTLINKYAPSSAIIPDVNVLVGKQFGFESILSNLVLAFANEISLYTNPSLYASQPTRQKYKNEGAIVDVINQPFDMVGGIGVSVVKPGFAAKYLYDKSFDRMDLSGLFENEADALFIKEARDEFNVLTYGMGAVPSMFAIGSMDSYLQQKNKLIKSNRLVKPEDTE